MQAKEPRQMRTFTITITEIPDHMPQGGGEIRALATLGQDLAREANPPELNPDQPAFRRAAISTSQIMRIARSQDNRIELALLVAMIAGNSDPKADDSTPQRLDLIHGP
jgi:hypothetical protein